MIRGTLKIGITINHGSGRAKTVIPVGAEVQAEEKGQYVYILYEGGRFRMPEGYLVNIDIKVPNNASLY